MEKPGVHPCGSSSGQGAPIPERVLLQRGRGTTACPDRTSVQASQDFFNGCRSLCLPHSSISIGKKENEGKRADITPAMGLGLTDHVWRIEEMMSFLYRQNIN